MAKTKKPMTVIKEYMAEIGRKGGLARAKNLTKEEIHRIAVMGGKKGGRPKKKKS